MRAPRRGSRDRFGLFRAWSAAAALALAGCAHAPRAGDPVSTDEPADPAESVNRAIFAGNQLLDRHLLKPIAQAYLDAVPDRVRLSIHHFVDNLNEPKVLVNDLLQGNVSRAAVTSQRFVLDTTLGGAGLFDVATGWGLPGHQADFGQTFGVWGIGPGPSVQLPLLGPSDARDAVGIALGFLANPLAQIPGNTMADITIAGGTLGMVDGRAELIPATDSLERTSLDYYAALRSLMAQRRAALVEDGREGKVVAHPALPPAEPSSSPDPSAPAVPQP